MALPVSPPSPSVAGLPVKLGSSGWPTYAVQGALGSAGLPVVQDGDFGPKTETAVRAFQRSKHLDVDGRVGPATSRALVSVVCGRVERSVPDMPDGLAEGMAAGEGGNNLYAVNWSVLGGVDCGLWQWRVYGPPYQQSAMEQAFSPHRAGMRAAMDFLSRRDAFLAEAWVGSSRERAGRCALMAHNWPAGAASIARYGTCSMPNESCSWVPRDSMGRSVVRFPDGYRVETRWDWCQFYAMGGPHGSGVIVRNVTHW